jgi:hypothetical protein
MQSQSQATACGWQPAGTWTVSFPFQPVSVSPANSSGTQALFTFTMAGFYPVSDSYEGDEVNLAFSTSTALGTLQFYDNGCTMVFGPDMTGLFLFADMASDSMGTSGALGSSTVLSNSQCSLDLATSSAELSGSTLSLRLAISFKSAFEGEKNIYEFGPGTGWPLGASYSPVGTFTVTTSRREPHR